MCVRTIVVCVRAHPWGVRKRQQNGSGGQQALPRELRTLARRPRVRAQGLGTSCQLIVGGAARFREQLAALAGAVRVAREGQFGVVGRRPPASALNTVIALEEPENSRAPQYLGRTIRQLRAASDFGDVKSLVATHAPTALRRVDPHSIRFLRLKPCTIREFDDGRCAHGVPDTAGRSFTSLRKSRTATVWTSTGLHGFPDMSPQRTDVRERTAREAHLPTTEMDSTCRS
jgi:hypothetical protein